MQDGGPNAAFIVPETSPAEANEGHLLLEWESVEEKNGNLIFQLQQAEGAEFQKPRTPYEGPDEGSYISGLPAGSTYFRVRVVSEEGSAGPWSETLEVQVQFPQQWKVILLMICGSFMFLFLVVTIIWGRKRTRSNAPSSS